jgi:hypothetical protein
MFFARAKNGRFLKSRVEEVGARFLVTRKKSVKKSYFVFNEQIVIFVFHLATLHATQIGQVGRLGLAVRNCKCE